MPGRRRVWIGVGLGFLAVVVAFAVLIVVADRSDRSRDAADRTSAPAEAPRIIPSPDAGAAPDQPGDRGGWAQLALLAVLVGGLALIALLVHRSIRRARRRPG